MGLKETLSKPTVWLRIIELILCIIGVVLIEMIGAFYKTWIYKLLIIGLDGYLIICGVTLIGLLLKDGEVPSPLVDMIFMIVGAVLNLVAGIANLVKYCNDDGYYSYLPKADRNNNLGVAIVAILAGAAMVVDCVLNFMSSKGEV